MEMEIEEDEFTAEDLAGFDHSRKNARRFLGGIENQDNNKFEHRWSKPLLFCDRFPASNQDRNRAGSGSSGGSGNSDRGNVYVQSSWSNNTATGSNSGFPPVNHHNGHGGEVSKYKSAGQEILFQNMSSSSQFIVSTNDALVKLTDRTGMPVTQENGQRRYGPPKDHVGPEPEKGCEVFIGKLPRDCYEPDIVPIVEKIGKIYEIRLMMDFSGTNRGYCFVKFYSVEEAVQAVAKLDNYEIRKGRMIGVLLSVDNCRLFLGGIPKDKTEEDIFEEIAKITAGVKRAICYPSVGDKNKNRGFAFIEYDSHKSAAMARRKMLPKKIPIWGLFLMVDWAEPLPNVDNSIMEKVMNLYVRNLMLSTTEETLVNLFNEHSNNGVERVKKMKDFAFVHFASREQAELAKNTLDSTNIDGSKVEINWAKPVDKDYKAKKALSRSLYASRNFHGGQGYTQNSLFGVYNSSGMNHYPNMALPIPIHDNVPMISGMSSYDQPRVMQPREINRGRAAAGVQSFHLSEELIMQQQARKIYPGHGSPNGYMQEQQMYGMQNPYYPHPHGLYQQDIQQHFAHEMPQYGY